MAEHHLTPEQCELYELMSDISEDCWCAGWLMGNEFALWGMATEPDANRSYGQVTVPEESLQRLRELSAAIGGWIYWHDDDHEPDLPAAEWGPRFVAMPEWLCMYGGNTKQEASHG